MTDMPELRLHNTLSGTKELFVPLDTSHIRVYACGPTVYDSVHIGNARPVIVFDGATPTLKKRTVARRRAFRQQQEGSLRRTAERILLNQLKGRHLLHGLTDMSAAAPSRSSPKASGLEAAAVESLARAAQFGEHDAAAATAASELQHSREAAEEEQDAEGRQGCRPGGDEPEQKADGAAQEARPEQVEVRRPSRHHQHVGRHRSARGLP